MVMDGSNELGRNQQERPLMRAVIKEELYTLLHRDHVKALILNQMLYWSERMQDFDRFITEERERAKEDIETVQINLTYGWIFKKAEELSVEIMVDLSKSSMMRHIKDLVDVGYLDQRRNPKNKMDKTYQYRVNIRKIQEDLLCMGLALEGYRIPVDFVTKPMRGSKDRGSVLELRSSKIELAKYQGKLRSSKTELRSSVLEPPSSKTEPPSSILEQQYQRLLSESTSEITELDISTRAQGEGSSSNKQNGILNQQVTIQDREEQNAALGQAVSGNNVLALVTQAQAEASATSEMTPVPADSPQPERTPEEKAFSEISTLYIDNKFTPSASFFVQDGLAQLVKEYGDTWVMGALQVALKYNSRSLGYVETVLDGWAKKGMAPWEKPKPTREAQRGGSVRQRGETASGGTANVQPGKYESFYEHYPHLRRRE